MIRIDDKIYGRDAFEAISARIAAVAGLEGAAPGTRYAVAIPDIAEWLALFFAIRAADASVLPIHPSTPHAAARALARRAGCATLFYGSLSPEPLGATQPQSAQGQILQMTSGTTGDPKCIARNWTDVDREIGSYVATFTEPNDMTPVIACPTTHSYGLICGLLAGLARGRVPLILSTGNPRYLMRQIAGVERPILYSSPAMLNTLARMMRGEERIHAVMTSGTLLPAPWFEAIRARSDQLFQQYGCSEAGCIAVNPRLEAAEDMGYVLPHHRLEAGRAGAPDEIVVIDGERRISTRDLGHLRDDGMLVFTARLDDTINVSGLNVYPGEVEDAALSMAQVTDAVAFRVKDQFAGERVGLAFSATRDIDPRDLREWLAGHLASHQLPMEIVQVRDVPRQGNGKISRRAVAERHAAGRLGMTEEVA